MEIALPIVTFTQADVYPTEHSDTNTRHNMFDFNRADNGDVSILTLTGILTINNVLQLSDTVDNLVYERRTKVTVDMSGLDLLDSSGVSMLMSLYKRVQIVGGQCKVVNPRDQPLAILQLLQMDEVILA